MMMTKWDRTFRRMTVGEVNWAGADGTNTVTRRPECCGDGGSAERGQTADTALLRDSVDRSCRRDDGTEVELEVKYEVGELRSDWKRRREEGWL